MIQLLVRYWREPAKIHQGFSALVAGLHMISYAKSLVQLYRNAVIVDDPEPVLAATST